MTTTTTAGTALSLVGGGPLGGKRAGAVNRHAAERASRSLLDALGTRHECLELTR